MLRIHLQGVALGGKQSRSGVSYLC